MTPATRNQLVLILVVVAGGLDAGTLLSARAFSAGMTGNLTLLGIAVAQAETTNVGRALLALLCYVVGVMVMARLTPAVPDGAHWSPHITRNLGLEAVGLAAACLVWAAGGDTWVVLVLVLTAFTMGMQSLSMARLAAPEASSTGMTLVLTKAVSRLANPDAAVPDAGHGLPRGGPHLLAVACYAGGAILIAAVYRLAPSWMLLPPLLGIVAVTWLASRVTRAASSAHPR